MHSTSLPSIPSVRPVSQTRTRSPAREAFEVLHWGFVALPVIAGLDKFTHLLANWDNYLSPTFARLSPLTPHNTMLAVGVIEVVAGLIVALRPKIGAIVVAGWLAAIIVNLALKGGFYDVALRDFGLILAAVALSRLATAKDRSELGGRTVIERIQG
ncbi:MAG: hypothetical protein ACXVEF_03035 [Polyangiales bacterium]